MQLSSAALFLNSFFSGYDTLILKIMHFFADKLGVVLTPLMKLITLVGEKGIIFFLLALVCMCFPRTRKFGVCVFGAVCCGALITNIILKDMVARPRPFETVEQFKQWWIAVGSPAEDDFSFPSGHVTAAAAGMTAISLMKGKKWIVPSVIWVVLMAISRNYLMAHYPSDVLVGAIIGVASGFIAWGITKLIFNFLEAKRGVPLFDLALDFDIGEILPLDGVIEKLGGIANKLPQKGEKSEKPARTERAPRAERSSRSAEPARRSGSHSKAEAPKPARTRGEGKARANVGYVGKHEKR